MQNGSQRGQIMNNDINANLLETGNDETERLALEAVSYTHLTLPTSDLV